MSLAASIAHTFWAVILKILGLFRRAICRSGRGRKNSGTLLPMTTEHISVDLQQSVPSSDVSILLVVSQHRKQVTKSINTVIFLQNTHKRDSIASLQMINQNLKLRTVIR